MSCYCDNCLKKNGEKCLAKYCSGCDQFTDYDFYQCGDCFDEVCETCFVAKIQIGKMVHCSSCERISCCNDENRSGPKPLEYCKKCGAEFCRECMESLLFQPDCAVDCHLWVDLEKFRKYGGCKKYYREHMNFIYPRVKPEPLPGHCNCK